LASVRLSPSREADIVEELTQHLQDRYAELLAAGATPDEAASLALEEFQSGTALASRLTPLRQAHAPIPLTPAAPTGTILTDLWLDVRSALRQFAQQPGYAAVVVATLAVCLAANLVIFAVVDGVVLRPLPFPDAHRLVAIYNTYPGAGRDIAPNSATDYFDRQPLAALSGLATFQRIGLTLGREGDASERVIGLAASPSLFPLIGTQAWRGRLLLDADAEPRLGPHRHCCSRTATGSGPLPGERVPSATRCMSTARRPSWSACYPNTGGSLIPRWRSSSRPSSPRRSVRRRSATATTTGDRWRAWRPTRRWLLCRVSSMR
jgi:hypothetical protein